MHDPQLVKVIDEVKQGHAYGFLLSKDGALCYGTRLYVLYMNNLRNKLMTQAYKTTYTMHLGSTKMYMDLKEYYWWGSMK